jgi:BON domain
MLFLRTPDPRMATGRFTTTRKENEMSTISLTDLDVRLRDHVVGQLDWDPEVDASQIGVAAKNGVVTLTGYIDTYAGKLAAERAAKRVRGVKGVANDLQVRLKIGRTDVDIARAPSSCAGPFQNPSRSPCTTDISP